MSSTNESRVASSLRLTGVSSQIRGRSEKAAVCLLRRPAEIRMYSCSVSHAEALCACKPFCPLPKRSDHVLQTLSTNRRRVVDGGSRHLPFVRPFPCAMCKRRRAGPRCFSRSKHGHAPFRRPSKWRRRTRSSPADGANGTTDATAETTRDDDAAAAAAATPHDGPSPATDPPRRTTTDPSIPIPPLTTDTTESLRRCHCQCEHQRGPPLPAGTPCGTHPATPGTAQATAATTPNAPAAPSAVVPV